MPVKIDKHFFIFKKVDNNKYNIMTACITKKEISLWKNNFLIELGYAFGEETNYFILDY